MTIGLFFSLAMHVAALGGLYGLVSLHWAASSGNGQPGFAVSFLPDGLCGGGGPAESTNESSTVSRPASVAGVEKQQVAVAGAIGVMETSVAKGRKPAMEKKKQDLLAQPATAAEAGIGRDGGLGPDSSIGGGGSAFGSGQGSGATRAVPVYAPKPPYPAQAKKDGFEGQVALYIHIAKDGSVSDAEIVKSSSRPDCDDAARETILRRWKFEPANLNGLGVASKEKVVVSYRLR